MPNRFRGRQGFVRSVKRKSNWIESADQSFVAVGGGASVIHQSIVALDGETIVRTRGILLVGPDVFTADTNVIGAIGFAVVSEQAAAAGAASIPGPFSNGAWDGWFHHEFYCYRMEFIDGSGVLSPATVQVPFDSKAMRKTEANDRIVVMVESQASAALVGIYFRMLFKLP